MKAQVHEMAVGGLVALVLHGLLGRPLLRVLGLHGLCGLLQSAHLLAKLLVLGPQGLVVRLAWPALGLRRT